MDPLTEDDPPVVGAYRLLGRLGRGGMGRVYLGRSAGGRTVAVKLVHPHIAADERFRARFAREVAAAQLVGGDWTAPVLDADPEAEVPWVATGYVAGPDLERAVAAHGAFPAHTVRALGAGLGEGLAAVHRHGLVHRDVKPSNVLLALDGPRLIDFGIARATDGGTARLTTTGVSIGSPGYMSPEQVLGRELTPATDVFSFGAVLAFAAGGRPPFPGGSAAHLLYRVVHEPPELDAVPPQARELIAACLDKDPAGRPTPLEVAGAYAGDAGAAGLVGSGWLPQPVVEDASRHAVRLLDLDTGHDPGPATTPAAPSTPVATTPAAPVAPGYAHTVAAPGPATPPFPPPGGSPPAPPRRRGRLVLGLVLGLALVAAAVVGGILLLGEEGEDPQGVPAAYLGEWTGNASISGMPIGTVTVELAEGQVGDVVGTVSATDAIGLSLCVDELTLSAVAEGQLTFLTELDPSRSTLSAACYPEPYEFVLRQIENGQLAFNGYADDNSYEGVAARQG
ncbi:serine/threonine-protein kinase [Streptomyces profundus]|uniref:serine/threonine-protein kinase n=1 Tax=Streptomyces profundus TaxID=2867410 RepID=UPI001D16A5EB|nr:serine/threonine-protein kinase [Streptomyces sp. MA3_2.13]UED85676.1 serine/threonine protein kinase [Streptomyces sp. MA3_2.13]